MADIGLDYCCHAGSDESEHFIPQNLLEYVDNDTTKIAKESRKSLLSNEFFRRDIYIRGDGADSDEEAVHLSVMGDWVIGSQYSDFQVQRTFPAYKSDVRFQDEIYAVLMNIAYQGRLNVTELCTHEKLSSYSPKATIEALHMLIKAEHLEVLVSKSLTQGVSAENQGEYTIAHPVNSYLLENRLLKDGKCQLAAPATGIILQLDLISGLCLLAFLKVRQQEYSGFISKQLNEFAEVFPKHPALPQRLELDKAKWLEEEIERFRENILPVLLRHNILH